MNKNIELPIKLLGIISIIITFWGALYLKIIQGNFGLENTFLMIYALLILIIFAISIIIFIIKDEFIKLLIQIKNLFLHIYSHYFRSTLTNFSFRKIIRKPAIESLSSSISFMVTRESIIDRYSTYDFDVNIFFVQSTKETIIKEKEIYKKNFYDHQGQSLNA